MFISKIRTNNSIGLESRELILEAAELILRREGYHRLSTRRVANECGISVGNLTYHFPNKVLLLEAMMVAVCNRYERTRAVVRPEDVCDPKSYLQRSLGWMLKDAVDAETSALFLELWVIAKHEQFAARLVEQFYSTAAGWIAHAFSELFPSSSKEDQSAAAYFFLTLSEGTVALFYRSEENEPRLDSMVEMGVNAVIGILS